MKKALKQENRLWYALLPQSVQERFDNAFDVQKAHVVGAQTKEQYMDMQMTYSEFFINCMDIVASAESIRIMKKNKPRQIGLGIVEFNEL